MRSKCFCANAFATEMPIPGLKLDVSANITINGRKQYAPTAEENEGWRAHFRDCVDVDFSFKYGQLTTNVVLLLHTEVDGALYICITSLNAMHFFTSLVEGSIPYQIGKEVKRPRRNGKYHSVD